MGGFTVFRFMPVCSPRFCSRLLSGLGEREQVFLEPFLDRAEALGVRRLGGFGSGVLARSGCLSNIVRSAALVFDSSNNDPEIEIAAGEMYCVGFSWKSVRCDLQYIERSISPLTGIWSVLIGWYGFEPIVSAESEERFEEELMRSR